ncbi:MAG: AAA family ATPase [Solirubrobacterales bacterium]
MPPASLHAPARMWPVRALAAAALATVAWAVPAQAQDAPTVSTCGTIGALSGEATLRGAGGTEPAAGGLPVFVGDELRTRHSGIVQISLGDGTLLRVGPSSRVRLAGSGCDTGRGRFDVRPTLVAGSLYADARGSAPELDPALRAFLPLEPRPDRGRVLTARAGETTAIVRRSDAVVSTQPGTVAVQMLAGDRVTVRAAGSEVDLGPERATDVGSGPPAKPRGFAVPENPFWSRTLARAGASPAPSGAEDPGAGFGYEDIEDAAITWLPIIFFAILVFLIAATMRRMPKTKPQQITPQSESAVGWDDIAGAEETKDELREVVEFLREPETFQKLGARVPKGILLHGPPGTGKTLLAKAVAHESGANFFSQSAASFIEMFAGIGAARIRRLFETARENAPAIVFIDELDAVGGARGSDVTGERDQTLNQLLVELDGFEGRDNVVVMAASNLLEKLDSALLRPGRFDRQVLVAPPDRAGRRRILDVHTANKPIGQDVDLDQIAAHTAGLTGADLANLSNEAAIFAGRARREFLAQRDFDDAFERVVAGLESRKVITDSEKQIIAWHEAGHALARELLPGMDMVQKVSIVPRGQALGFTLNLPQEDRYLRSRDDLLDHMTVLLAGRVAEQLTFGRATTGAVDDLRRVTEIARSMVYEYAMGTTIRSLQVPGNDFGVSEQLKRIRDEEVQQLADEAYRRAERMLTQHRDVLDELATTLLEAEVLGREDIERIVGRPAARDDKPDED